MVRVHDPVTAKPSRLAVNILAHLITLAIMIAIGIAVVALSPPPLTPQQYVSTMITTNSSH